MFALIAMGLVIIFRCSHSINFAQGDIGALGAFLSLSLTTAGAHVVPIWLAVIIGILVSAAANLILYVVYVRFLEKSLGPNQLWIAGYCNDVFGYLPSARVLTEGGYETRGLYSGAAGIFDPKAEEVVVEKVRELARKAGRKVP